MRDEHEESVCVPGTELAEMALRRRLTAGAAHTLNNVFTSLLGELALLEDERKGDPVVEEASHALREQLERCVRLVRNGLTRPDFGASTSGEVDLGLLLSRCERVLEGTLSRQIELRTHIPDESWLIRGDPHDIEVLLLALTFRLGDLIPTGCSEVGISLCAGDAERTISLRLEILAAELPPDARQRLVDPALVRDATEAAALTAIHAIAERHGTHLETERTDRVVLPFCRSPE